MKKLKFEWILPALAGLIVFLPTLGTYFSQDDWVFLSHVYKQPFLSVFKHYPEAFYRPVGQQLFFFIGSRLFGLEAQGYHLTGLAIHLLNIWLLSRVMNIWTHDLRVKYFLLTFYAVNPAHFVALNWLTQVDLEIAVSLALVSTYLLRLGLARQGQAFLLQICGLVLYLFGVLSHEVVVFLPIVWWIWFKQKRIAIFGFAAGLALIGTKFLVNPFSSQGDYRVMLDPAAVFAAIRWYLLRALMIPEGIRNLPVWVMILSLIPGLILTLMFRQKLARGLGVYLLGVLPVLGFGSHLLAAYAVFGIALMVIELGRSGKFGTPRNDGIKVSVGLWVSAMAAIILLSLALVYFTYSNHWSIGRGRVSRQLTQEYIFADSDGKQEVLSRLKDFENNPEIYFSTMMGKQFEVLDRSDGRGIFDILFYRGNDMTTQFLPDAEFFATSIKQGKFPSWNPWIFAGTPYFLDPQNFLWYPPNYIFLLMPVEAGFLVLLIGHLALAGWTMKKVLGEFGIFGPPSPRLRRVNKLALLGAIMFVFSPKMVGHIEEGNWTLVIAAAWLPALYYGLKKKSFWWAIISLAAIIINNLNIGYYSIIFVFSYFVLKNLLSDRLTISLISLIRILLAVLIVSALTLPRWLPLAVFGGQTVRANLAEAPLPLWSWTKIGKSLVFPLSGGYPVLQNEEILYVGAVPILLIIAYLVFKGPALPRQGRALSEIRFWLIWAIFILVVALNNKTPLFYLINKLPGFSLLRITTRPWIFVSLAAALAVPSMIRQIRDIGQIRGIRMSRKFSNFVIAVLSGLTLIEFIWFDWRIFNRREVVEDPVPKRFYRQMAMGGVMARAYCTTGCLDRLTAQRMGIALLGGNNPIQLKSFVEYLQAAGGYKETGYHPILPPYTVFNQQPQPDAELLGKTAVKFVVSTFELRDNNLKLIDQEGEYRLYRNDAKMEVKDHYFELY